MEPFPLGAETQPRLAAGEGASAGHTPTPSCERGESLSWEEAEGEGEWPCSGRGCEGLAPKLSWRLRPRTGPGGSVPGDAVGCEGSANPRTREGAAPPGHHHVELEARGPRGRHLQWPAVLSAHSVADGGQGRAQQDTGCRLHGLDPLLTPGPGGSRARPAPSAVPPVTHSPADRQGFVSISSELPVPWPVLSAGMRACPALARAPGQSSESSGVTGLHTPAFSDTRHRRVTFKL